MAFLCGRTGRLAALFGGIRRGQVRPRLQALALRAGEELGVLPAGGGGRSLSARCLELIRYHGGEVQLQRVHRAARCDQMG
jgi:hypothetical protein